MTPIEYFFKRSVVGPYVQSLNEMLLIFDRNSGYVILDVKYAKYAKCRRHLSQFESETIHTMQWKIFLKNTVQMHLTKIQCND